MFMFTKHKFIIACNNKFCKTNIIGLPIIYSCTINYFFKIINIACNIIIGFPINNIVYHIIISAAALIIIRAKSNEDERRLILI